MIVSVTTVKGGVGKTTTSVFLAHAAQRDGWTVFLADADPQGSALRWADQLEKQGTPLPFSVGKVSERDIARFAAEVRAMGEKVVAFIDTPPGNEKVIRSAVKVSDFAVVPATPGPDDVDRAKTALAGVTHGCPAAVLMTKFDKRTKLSYDTLLALQGDPDVPMFPMAIPFSARIAAANLGYSGPVGRLFRYDLVWKQIKTVLAADTDTVPA